MGKSVITRPQLECFSATLSVVFQHSHCTIFGVATEKKHWFAEALSEGISLSSRLFFHAYQMFFIKKEDDTEKIGIFAHNYKCNHNEKKPNPYIYEHIGAVSKSAIV